MNDEILNALDEEIAQLKEARAILTESGSATRKPAAGNKPRRSLSAKARRAIAEAQHRRWAKVKSQQKAAT